MPRGGQGGPGDRQKPAAAGLDGGTVRNQVPAVKAAVEHGRNPDTSIGMHEAQIEMLFVDPARFGQGIGTALVDHAREQHAKLTVDVNEQNPRAHEFYRRYGFEDVGRSETDSAGRPFPLVHMALRH